MSLAQDPGRIRDITRELAAGSLTSVALVQRCLDRIEEVDGKVQAWVHVLKDEALAAARLLDAERKAGRVRGPLHGIPVAIKDIIDVKGLQTRAGSRSRADIAPASHDATIVAHLRAEGAVILGKVHTTEYAYFEAVPPTRNPFGLTRTPGGSSGGSAAAVAAGMVPIAVGTQTAGSVNRPAAFCGVGAFKPSTLSVSGAGIVPLAPSFDTPGAFGFLPEDAVALAAAFAPDHLGLHMPADGPAPALILIKDAFIDRCSEDMRAAVSGLHRTLGEGRSVRFSLEERAGPVPLADIVATHRTVLLAELGRMHRAVPRDRIAPRLAADMDAGLAIADADYTDALQALKAMRRKFWAAFKPNDVILLPGAPGIAPDDGSTGDPSYVIATTALGGPVVSLNAGFCAKTGMPLGAVMFARPGADSRLAGIASKVG